MSATNRGSTRKENDHYPTPLWPTQWFLQKYKLPGNRFLEPCVGEGSIVSAIEEYQPSTNRVWFWNDISIVPDPKFEKGKFYDFIARSHNEDFLTTNRYANIDCIITNPPYSLAEQFLDKSLEIAPVVIFLLRLNWLGSLKRAKRLQAFKPDVYVLSKRPSFGLNKKGKPGTDACEYGWFVWDQNKPNKQLGKIEILSGEL